MPKPAAENPGRIGTAWRDDAFRLCFFMICFVLIFGCGQESPEVTRPGPDLTEDEKFQLWLRTEPVGIDVTRMKGDLANDFPVELGMSLAGVKSILRQKTEEAEIRFSQDRSTFDGLYTYHTNWPSNFVFENAHFYKFRVEGKHDFFVHLALTNGRVGSIYVMPGGGPSGPLAPPFHLKGAEIPMADVLN